MQRCTTVKHPSRDRGKGHPSLHRRVSPHRYESRRDNLRRGPQSTPRPGALAVPAGGSEQGGEERVEEEGSSQSASPPFCLQTASSSEKVSTGSVISICPPDGLIFVCEEKETAQNRDAQQVLSQDSQKDGGRRRSGLLPNAGAAAQVASTSAQSNAARAIFK